MEQYPNFNFVGSEAVKELGIISGGSDEAQINDLGYEESFVLLDDDMMMMIAMIAFQMGSTWCWSTIIPVQLHLHHWSEMDSFSLEDLG